MPEQKDAMLTALQQRQELQFAGGRLHTPSPEVAAAIGDTLKCFLGRDETIQTGLQTGKMSRAPQRAGWTGNMSWYLIVPKALLEIEVTATLGEGQWTTTVTRAKRWPLRILRWSQIEETRLPSPNDVSAKVTLAFGDALLTIESTAIQSLDIPTREAESAEQGRIAREFLAQLVLGSTRVR
jgi:hypothetical protein